MKRSNIKTQLSLFLCLIIAINAINLSYAKSLSNLHLKKSLKQTQQETQDSEYNGVDQNNYGFYCFELSGKFQALRLGLTGQIECFSMDRTKCFQADSKQKCVQSLLLNFKTSLDSVFNTPAEDEIQSTKGKIIMCPILFSEYKEKFSWCVDAENLFYEKWICPETSNLDFSFRVNRFTGNMECLTNGISAECLTGEASSNACYLENNCLEKGKSNSPTSSCLNTKENVLECWRKSDTIDFSWCKDALLSLIDKDLFLLPTVTEKPYIVKVNNLGNLGIVSIDGEKPYQYSKTPIKQIEEYVSDYIKKGLYTILEFPDQKSSLDVLRNILVSFTINQPITEFSREVHNKLKEIIINDSAAIDLLKAQINAIQNNLDKKLKEISFYEAASSDKTKITNSVFINNLKIEGFNLQKQLNEKQIELINLEIKASEETSKFKVQQYQILSEEIKRQQKLITTEEYSKDHLLAIKINKEITKLDEVGKTIKDEISKINSVIENLSSAKKDKLNSIKSNNDKIIDITNKNKEIAAELEELKKSVNGQVDYIPILVKPASFVNKEYLKDKYVTSKTKYEKYIDDFIKYEPILSDNLVADNINRQIREFKENFSITLPETITNKVTTSIVFSQFNYISNSITNTKFTDFDVKLLTNQFSTNKKILEELGSDPRLDYYKNLQIYPTIGDKVKNGEMIVLNFERFNRCLSSQNYYYLFPSTGSKQIEVNSEPLIVNGKLNENTLFKIEVVDQGQNLIKNGSYISLRHVLTNKVLFSNPNFVSPSTNRQELVLFTGNEEVLAKNSNHIFKLFIAKSPSNNSDNFLSIGDNLRLCSVTTNFCVGTSDYKTPRTGKYEIMVGKMDEETAINLKFTYSMTLTAKFSSENKTLSAVSEQMINSYKDKATSLEPSSPINTNLTTLNIKKNTSNNIEHSISDNVKLENTSCYIGVQRPFCLSVESLNNETFNHFILENPFINLLKNVEFNGFGKAILNLDMILMYSVFQRSYLTFSTKRLLSSNSSGNNKATFSDKKSDLSKLKIDAILNSNGEVKFNLFILDSTNKKYYLIVSNGFYSENSGFLLKNEVSFALLTTINSTVKGITWERRILNKIDESNDFKVGQTFMLYNIDRQCYLHVSNLRDQDNLLEAVCSGSVSNGSVFTVPYLNNLNSNLNKIADISQPDFTIAESGIFNTKTEENKLKQQIESIEKEIANYNTIVDDCKNPAAVTKKSLTSEKCELANFKFKELTNLLKNEKAKFEKESNLSISLFDKVDINLKQTDFISNCNEHKSYYYSFWKSNKCSALTEINNLKSNANNGLIVEMNNLNNGKDFDNKLITLKHDMTKAYINLKDGLDYSIGYLKQNNGNVIYLKKTEIGYSIINFLTGRNLSVTKETNKDYIDNYKYNLKVYWSNNQWGKGHKNSFFELRKSLSDSTNATYGSKFVLFNKFYKCYLAFVPDKLISTYYMTYCASTESNIPSTFFNFSSDLAIDFNEDIFLDNDLSLTKLVSLDTNHTPTIKNSNAENLLPIPIVSKPLIYATAPIKNSIMNQDIVSLKFNDYTLLSHFTPLMGLGMQEVLGSKTGYSTIKNFRLVGTSKYLTNGSTVKLVHLATGKCLTTRNIAFNAKIKNFIVFADGIEGNCDTYSEWILKKVEIDSDKLSEIKNEKLSYDSSYVLMHKYYKKYLTYITYASYFGKDNKNENIMFTLHESIDKVDKTFKFDFSGRLSSQEKQYFEFSESDSHSKISSTVSSNSKYNLFKFYEYTENTNWKNLMTSPPQSTDKIPEIWKLIKSKSVDTQKIFNNLKNLIPALENKFNIIKNGLPERLDVFKSPKKLVASSSNNFVAVKPKSINLTNDFKVITYKTQLQNYKDFKTLESKISQEIGNFKLQGDFKIKSDAKQFKLPVNTQITNNSMDFKMPVNTELKTDLKDFRQIKNEEKKIESMLMKEIKHIEKSSIQLDNSLAIENLIMKQINNIEKLNDSMKFGDSVKNNAKSQEPLSFSGNSLINLESTDKAKEINKSFTIQNRQIQNDRMEMILAGPPKKVSSDKKS